MDSYRLWNDSALCQSDRHHVVGLARWRRHSYPEPDMAKHKAMAKAEERGRQQAAQKSGR
jgi:hypothetical protein